MKRIVVIFSLIFATMSYLYSGDTARFVNLGFSADGSYFMFGQHGFQVDRGRTYSDLYIVDVEKNVYTAGGVLSGEYETVIEPGQSSDGALFTLLEDSIEKRKRYGISYLEKGRPLYIRIPEIEAEDDESDTLDFRDFERDMKYTVKLMQTTEGEGSAVKSKFHIDLMVEYKNGISKDFTVGHPEYTRQGVTEYNINRILLSPEENALVFIISKIDNELNVRYMIETVRIH